MSIILQIAIATGAITLLSLLGVLVFGKRGHLSGSNRFLIPFAIGTFLGVVFFELIPETLEMAGEAGSIAIAFGFLSFYVLSHLLHTFHHHHHTDEHDHCETNKAGASMLLAGDTVHNLADGIVIASAFLINPAVGIAATLGIALHEIPQEIAEYGVLLKAGYSKKKAALLNFLTASSVFIGAIATILFAQRLGEFIWIFTGIAAGNLLYIAASDMIPDVHAETRKEGRFFGTFLATLGGLIVIVLLLGWAHEEFGHGHEEHESKLHHDGEHDAEHEHEEEGHDDHVDEQSAAAITATQPDAAAALENLKTFVPTEPLEVQ